MTRHLEARTVGQVAEDELRVEDLEVGGGDDVSRRDDAGTVLGDVGLDLAVPLRGAADEALQVQDDVRDVLADARDRRELVLDALDLDGRDCTALERREQDAPQRVAERVAEATIERFDREHSTVIVDLFGGDLRDLEIEHGGHHFE